MNVVSIDVYIKKVRSSKLASISLRISLIAIVVELVLLFFGFAVTGGKTYGWNEKPLINPTENWILFLIPIVVIIISLVLVNWSTKLTDALLKFYNDQFHLVINGETISFDNAQIKIDDSNIIINTAEKNYDLSCSNENDLNTVRGFINAYNLKTTNSNKL